ncbi:sugar phosphate isomerase/epimerase [Eubacteriales bacterium OttesenSCG-928-A19]|nr:sugar phosphate isomerase/epimerase [Eubacteriales bacterium OttesenSCG-928-A19]
MRIGVSSYSFAQYMERTGANYLDICQIAHEMGFEGIEFIDLDLAVQPAPSMEALADAIREGCAALGLTICAYTVGADFMAADAMAEAERLRGCVDIAARLGAPVMRHDATRGQGLTDWRQAVATMAPAIRALAEYAQSKGVRTCTENHGYFIQDANRVESLVLEVDHPAYGWLVDIGNFVCADEDSAHGVAIAAPYAIHAHAKDFLIKPAHADNPGDGWFRSRQGRYLRGTIPGHGDIALRDCVRILRESGYEGWLSYEFEGPEENLPALEAGLAYLRGIVGA